MRRRLFKARLPLVAPMATANGVVQERELILLELTDENGAVGIGEAAPLPGYSAAALDDCLAALRTGEPGPPEAAACEEMARIDLGAGAAGHSLVERIAEVELNATLTGDSPIELAAAASAALAKGFACVKLKVGFADDLDRVTAVREALGRGPRLRTDANASWTVDEAVAAIERLAEFDLELVEQPCATLAELAAVRARVEIPIAADEAVSGVEDLQRAIEADACDLVCVKLAAAGGVLNAEAVIESARAAGLGTYVASTLDGPWGISAGLMLAAHSGVTMACGLATLELFEEPIASALPRPIGARIEAPDGLGLGVDPALIAKLGDLVEEIEQ